MTDLILWNSIASRRRSPSDAFLDNGIGILKAYIEKRGFKVEVIDWARNCQWEKITPGILARFNHILAANQMSSNGSGKQDRKRAARLLAPVFLLSQEVMSAVQRLRLRKMIRQLARQIRDSGCRVVGIKAWYGEAYLAAKYFARCLRNLAPEVLIVVGGPHSSIYKEAVLEDRDFDLAVVGEGEKVLCGILALARQSKSRHSLMEEIAGKAEQGQLKNIIYRSNGKVKKSVTEKADADTKVIPVYDDLEGKTRIHVVVDSLGCPWGKCNFCVHSYIYQNHSRRSAQSVADEIEEMVSRGMGIFRLAGSSTSPYHVSEIVDLLGKKGISIVFSMFSRAEKEANKPALYRELVDLYRKLIRSGMRAVFIGAESAVDSINELVMNKGVSCEEIVATVAAIREASKAEKLRVDIGLSMIYPAPTMGKVTLEELKAENIKLVEQIQPDSVLVSPSAPFPGTTWFNDKERFGFELGENFVQEMLEYDYVLYKPPSLWPEVDLKLDGISSKEIFEKCQNMRNSLEERGFVTEVTDEHFLMMRLAGYSDKESALRFKKQVLLSLISCDYRWINRLQETVNQASLEKAQINTR
ncbi:B12-binding domain-containing radical SAM protein [Gemmatimonadota bacterium]